jgi:hypothetical protein
VFSAGVAITILFNSAASQDAFFKIPEQPPRTDTDTQKLPPRTNRLDAPSQAILAMAVKNKKINIDPAIFKDKSKLALDWAHINAREELNAYYKLIGQKVDKDCAGTINKCSKEVQDYMLELYKSFKLSENFQKWDEAHRKEFVKLAAGDPLLVHANNHWNYLKTDQKLAAATRIGELYAKAYSGDGVQFSASNTYITDLPEGWGGSYYGDRIDIDVDMARASFSDFAKVEVHEARHSLQDKLTTLLKSKEGMAYLKKYGIEHDVALFKAVGGSLRLRYDDTKLTTEEAYIFAPKEVDAYAVMTDGSRVGTEWNTMPDLLYREINSVRSGNQWDRKDTIRKFDAHIQYQNTYRLTH